MEILVFLDGLRLLDAADVLASSNSFMSSDAIDKLASLDDLGLPGVANVLAF